MRNRIKKFYRKMRKKARRKVRRVLKRAGLAAPAGKKKKVSGAASKNNSPRVAKRLDWSLRSKQGYLKHRALAALARWRNREKPEAEKLKLKQNLKDEPGSAAKVMKLAGYYRDRGNCRQADRLYQQALKFKPGDERILLEYAKNAFVQGYWEEGLSRYEQLFKELERKNVKENRELQKIWLEASRQKSNLLQYLRCFDDLVKQKEQLYEALNGPGDLQEVICYAFSEKLADDDSTVHTEVFPRGMASFYVCMHRIEYAGRKKTVVEKCLPVTSREQLLYRLIREHCLFTGTRHAGVPRLLGIIDGEQYVKLYLSHVAGEKVSLRQVDHYNYGFALGEIAGEFSALPPEDTFKVRPLRYADLRRIEASLARLIDYSEFRDILQALEQYNKNLDSLAEAKKALPRVFSHNDITPGNILHRGEDPAEHFYFLDWEKACYNAAGSDLGGLIKGCVLEKITGEEQKRVEKASREGYSAAVAGIYPGVTAEELEFAANLFFVTRNLNTALQTMNLDLFKEMKTRIRWLLESNYVRPG